MRTIIFIALMGTMINAKAQSFIPGSFIDNNYRVSSATDYHLGDSISTKKWSFSRYSAISTGFSVFKGGSASFLSVPVGFQLNRTLNNNLYAFANVSVAPSYVNFNRSFIANDLNNKNQNGPFFNRGNLGVYSRASLGLQYVNDEKTFSISGSIGVERSSYPVLPYNQVYQARPNRALPENK